MRTDAWTLNDWERECLELVLHLDAAGKGAKAWTLHRRATRDEIRPLLKRAEAALISVSHRAKADEARHGGKLIYTPETIALSAKANAAAVHADTEIKITWQRLHARLCALGLEDEG